MIEIERGKSLIINTVLVDLFTYECEDSDFVGGSDMFPLDSVSRKNQESVCVFHDNKFYELIYHKDKSNVVQA